MFLSVYSCKPVFSSALELLLNLYCEHVWRGLKAMVLEVHVSAVETRVSHQNNYRLINKINILPS